MNTDKLVLAWIAKELRQPRVLTHSREPEHECEIDIGFQYRVTHQQFQRLMIASGYEPIIVDRPDDPRYRVKFLWQVEKAMTQPTYCRICGRPVSGTSYDNLGSASLCEDCYADGQSQQSLHERDRRHRRSLLGGARQSLGPLNSVRCPLGGRRE